MANSKWKLSVLFCFMTSRSLIDHSLFVEREDFLGKTQWLTRKIL